jgi:hypothetical protein
MFWHWAELAFGEAFGFDGKGPVEAGAGVFPGDDGSQLDQLALGEVSAEQGIQLVGNVRRGARQSCSEAQHYFLLIIEMRAGFELRQILKLLLADAFFSAHGRMNVNSKRAPHHQRHFQLRDFFQVH